MESMNIPTLRHRLFNVLHVIQGDRTIKADGWNELLTGGNKLGDLELTEKVAEEGVRAGLPTEVMEASTSTSMYYK